MKFTQKLLNAVNEVDSPLCVGLDPNLERLPETINTANSTPEEQVLHFLKQIIEITTPHCAAYKPNLAFFEALGAGGLEIFQAVINIIPDDKIIIADAKRGDISTTAEHYARAFFEQFDVDAITLNPLMGFETLKPFLRNEEKAVFVLTLTSNPGASDFLMKPFGGSNTMAEYIAKSLKTINEEFASHAGMVVGATKAKEVGTVIRHHPKAALLIPGMGAQGGAISEVKILLKNHEGVPLFNSSRSILYAGEGKNDWKKKVEKKAKESKQELNSILKANV